MELKRSVNIFIWPYVHINFHFYYFHIHSEGNFILRAPPFYRSPTSSSTSHSRSSKRRTESRSHKQRSKSSSSRRSRSQSPPRRRSRTQSPPRRRSRSCSPRHSSRNRHQSRPHSPRSQRRHRYCMHCGTGNLVCTFTSAIYLSTSWTIRCLISETLPTFFCCFSMYFHSLLQLNAPTHSTHLEWVNGTIFTALYHRW